jgi:hypothetical protein
LIPDPDPDFFVTKNYVFLDKNAIYLFLCLLERFKAPGQAFDPQREHPAPQKMKSILPFTFLAADLDPDLGFSPGHKYFFSSFKFFRS